MRIFDITTQEFTSLPIGSKQKIFSEVLNSKVNSIIRGSMTNGKRGEYRVRHDTYAYSNIKVEPNEEGKTVISVYNFETHQWQ